MVTTGYFVGAQEDGDELLVTFSVAKETDIGNLEGKLDISVEKIYEKRSLQANKYLWKLCSLIGNVVHMDKTSVYMKMLFKYGVWCDYQLPLDSYPFIFRTYKYAEVLNMDDEWVDVRVYIGSSEYDKNEFGQLLSGTIEDAKELGIQTWSDEDFNYLMENWDGKK